MSYINAVFDRALQSFKQAAHGYVEAEPSVADEAIDVTFDALAHRSYKGFDGGVFVASDLYGIAVAWSQSDRERTGIDNDTETRLDSLIAQSAAAFSAVRQGEMSSMFRLEYDASSKRGNPRHARVMVSATPYGVLLQFAP